MKPLVSFIIPTFNEEQHITRCLAAIVAVRPLLQPHEVLVLDNGSTDRTCEIVKEFGFKPTVIPEIKVGALRNRGAERAQGIYLALVDADVEIANDWLHNAINGFHDPRVVASGCFPGVPEQATWVQRTWDLHQRGAITNRKSHPTAWLSSMNLIVKRESFLEIGGFNETLETAEDVDLCYRLGKQGVILNNPTMEAIHWGEAADLCTFWRKEVWRGIGNLGGIRSHGLRWDEIPSIGYPLYMLACALGLVVGAGIDWWWQQMIVSPLSLVASIIPAFLLALRTSFRVKPVSMIASLFLLYYLYGIARAWAVLKAIFNTLVDKKNFVS